MPKSKLDKKRTMINYRSRLQSLPSELYKQWFDNKWISSFATRSSIHTGQTIPTHFRKYYPVQTYLIAVEKGATPLGITTEHKKMNKFICPVRQTLDPGQIAYIGKYSHFSGHTLKQKDNPFALKPEDKVYCVSQEQIVCSYYLRSSERSSTNI